MSHTNTQENTSTNHVLPSRQQPLFYSPPPRPTLASPFPYLIPLPLLLFLSFIPFLCTVRRREEERDGGRNGVKEGDLLLAFRWFHMKSQSTHLGCRHWRPTKSHLLPLNIPELAFNCVYGPGMHQCRHRHICEQMRLSTCTYRCAQIYKH